MPPLFRLIAKAIKGVNKPVVGVHLLLLHRYTPRQFDNTKVFSDSISKEGRVRQAAASKVPCHSAPVR